MVMAGYLKESEFEACFLVAGCLESVEQQSKVVGY